jgi:predicted SprT family Zn-dependent metalloprotease
VSSVRRVAARYLVAKQIPLTAERIRQVQREAEIFAANAEVIADETDHARVQEAAYAWRNATKPLYAEAMKVANGLSDAMEDRAKAKRLLDTWRAKFMPLFQVVLEVGSFPDWQYWSRLKFPWIQKVRAAASSLDGTITFLGTLRKKKMTPMVHQLTSEQRTIEGFDVKLTEYNAENPAHDEALQVVREALKRYRQRAQQVIPLLLKLTLPFFVDFSITPSLTGVAGTYADSHINLNPFGSGSNPNTLSKTIAHEMAHHVYFAWMTEPQRSFWQKALATDWTEIDLVDVLGEWDRRAEYWASFMTDLMRTEPILYLQLSGALEHSKTMPKELRDDEGWSRENLRRYLDRGGKRKVRVPATPITAYATANASEAFAEALGSLVAYGPRAVMPLVREWLNFIFGRHVKLAATLATRAPLPTNPKRAYQEQNHWEGAADDLAKFNGLYAQVRKKPKDEKVLRKAINTASKFMGLAIWRRKCLEDDPSYAPLFAAEKEVYTLAKNKGASAEALLAGLEHFEAAAQRAIDSTAPEKFNYQGFEVRNPQRFGDLACRRILGGVDYLVALFKKRGVEKLIGAGVARIILVYDAEVIAHFNSGTRELVLGVGQMLKGHAARILDDFTNETILHEFGHYVHRVYLTGEAREAWNEPWGDLPSLANPRAIQPRDRQQRIDPLEIVTDYGQVDQFEDFAETFVVFMDAPEMLTPTAKFRMQRALSLSGLYGKPVMRLATGNANTWKAVARRFLAGPG